MDVKIGERFTIPKDQYGEPVLEINPKTRKFESRLQTFEVVGINPDGGIRAKPVWGRR